MTSAKQPIQAVLFDLDGTLLDTSFDLYNAAVKTAIHFNKAVPYNRLEMYPLFGEGAAAILSHLFGHTPTPEQLHYFLQCYRDDLHQHTVEYVGIAELLQQLSAIGLLWGIVTNKPDHLTQPLTKHFGYHDSASCIVSGNTTPHKKPHPAPLHHAVSELNQVKPIQAQNCLYVGDHQRDIEAGRAAQMQTLGISYGFVDPRVDLNNWQADHIVDHPEKVLDFLHQ